VVRPGDRLVLVTVGPTGLAPVLVVVAVLVVGGIVTGALGGRLAAHGAPSEGPPVGAGALTVCIVPVRSNSSPTIPERSDVIVST